MGLIEEGYRRLVTNETDILNQIEQKGRAISAHSTTNELLQNEMQERDNRLRKSLHNAITNSPYGADVLSLTFAKVI